MSAVVFQKALTLVTALAVLTIIILGIIPTKFHQRAVISKAIGKSELPGLKDLKKGQLDQGINLPMEEFTLPIEELLKKQWMADLRDYLHKIPPGSLVSIVSSDSNYQNMLLNWLISATRIDPPLSHILILSLDKPLQRTLMNHGFDSVYVDYKDILIEKVWTNRRLILFMIETLRLTVMRLMNHWGYDAANYDTDAIVLKNPEQLYYGDFKNSDLIGSRGAFPGSVKAIFGLTMCAGAFMIKSTPKSGMAILSSYLVTLAL